ncbi:hypothetical protein So717_43350 [Roseobacter cerasinus]|uniref:HTH cro/C1-type domain-containing protein n=1 Tax=Roseobacter cerasinus TaxID=2602289 RepID=A0A640VY23_9RHOB|nr:hypothetical protein [Roseobacter cerasinus]GFE52582.1 hypothetical protein So717_43350 [Roseobacter cerasinus]
MSIGITRGCKPLVEGLPATIKAISDAAGVNDASVRRFKNGDTPIRRTTFNKISHAIKETWGIDIPADVHFHETST